MDSHIRRYLKAMARKGGTARARKLTPARRRAIAQQGAAARWAKRAKPGEG